MDLGYSVAKCIDQNVTSSRDKGTHNDNARGVNIARLHTCGNNACWGGFNEAIVMGKTKPLQLSENRNRVKVNMC